MPPHGVDTGQGTMPPHGAYVEKRIATQDVGFSLRQYAFCFLNIGVERFVLHECPQSFGGGVFPGFDSWLVYWTAPFFLLFCVVKKKGTVWGRGEVYRTVH